MTTKRMRYEELLSRLLMKVVEFILMPILVVLVLIAVDGDRKIRALEEELRSTETVIYGERIPVRECVRMYIDSLPIPDMSLVSENVETEETTEIPSEEDVMLLAKLMHAEEGTLRYSLSYEDAKMAHMLCGSVVLHRLNMHYRGANTIEEVIYMSGQYASVENLDQEVPEETIQWARELLENGPMGPEDMIYQAEFEQGEDIYENIGNQYFCTINEIE